MSEIKAIDTIYRGHRYRWDDPIILQAFNMARQMRFEHGENI